MHNSYYYPVSKGYNTDIYIRLLILFIQVLLERRGRDEEDRNEGEPPSFLKVHHL